jgi:hypothetical protein
MKVNFSAPLVGLDGKALQEGNAPPLTLGKACEMALVAATPQSQSETGEEKYKAWKLAQRVASGEHDISPEDASYLKLKIGHFFTTAVVGPAYDLLNG